MEPSPHTRRRRSEQATWCSLPGQQVGVLTATYVTQDFPRHFHDTYVVCVNEKGAHGSWYRGAHRVVPEAALTLVPPGEVHTGRRLPGHDWHYRALYPSVEVMAALAREAGVRAVDIVLASGLSTGDHDLAERFLVVHRHCADQPDTLGAESAVTELLVTMLRRHASGQRRRVPPPPTAPSVRQLRDYLHDHLTDRITLADLARATGLSSYTVLRAFRQVMGMPPHRYLTQLRVHRAAELLRGGVAPTAVAHLVGFADQSHLHRHFRRLLGVTPGAFVRGR